MEVSPEDEVIGGSQWTWREEPEEELKQFASVITIEGTEPLYGPGGDSL